MVLGISGVRTGSCESMTAIGVLLRVLAGENPSTSDPVKKGAKLMAALPPVWDPKDGSIDLYYWQAGALAMAQVGGAEAEVAAVERGQGPSRDGPGQGGPAGGLKGLDQPRPMPLAAGLVGDHAAHPNARLELGEPFDDGGQAPRRPVRVDYQEHRRVQPEGDLTQGGAPSAHAPTTSSASRIDSRV